MKTSLRTMSLEAAAAEQSYATKRMWIGYWVSTGVVAVVMGYSGFAYLRYAPASFADLFALASGTFLIRNDPVSGSAVFLAMLARLKNGRTRCLLSPLWQTFPLRFGGGRERSASLSCSPARNSFT